MAASNLKDKKFHKKLKKITNMKIPYPDNVEISEKPELILYKTRTKGLDFKYPPISISDMPKTLGDDYLRSSFKGNMVESDYSITEVNFDITTALCKQNFKIGTKFHQLEPLVPKKNLNVFKDFIGGFLTEYPADIERFLDEDVNHNIYSIILGTKEKPKKIWLYNSFTGTKPIIILRGFDAWLRPNLNIMPPTAMHVCNILKIAERSENLNIQGDLAPRNYLVYYLKNSLLKFGSIYWLVKDFEKVYLYDLTSSFQINDYVNRHNAEITAAMNAVGLLYFYSAKKCYLENDEKHFKLIKMWLYRALMLIDKFTNPIEFGFAYKIYEQKIKSAELKIDTRVVPVVGDDREFLFLIYKNMEADIFSPTIDLKLLKKSTLRLEMCIMYILNRLNAKEINPFQTINWTFKSNDFSFEKIISKLLGLRVEDFSNKDFETYAPVPFMKMYREDWDCRTLIYLVLKLFQNFLSTAKLKQRQNRLGMSLAYLKLCLKIWNFLNDLISTTEPLPLPLEPLLRIGEISYRLSLDEDLARRECQTCENFYNRKCDEYPYITFVTKDERCDLQFPGENDDYRFSFAQLSLEYYARAVLCTDVKPSPNLLMRICYIANAISYKYLDNLQRSIANFQFRQSSFELLKKISKFVDVSIKFSREIDDGQSILMAYCNRAKYLKTYYHIHKFLNSGRHNTELLIKYYDKIIEEYKNARAYVRFTSDMPINVWNAFIWDFTKFIMEYINILKEMEIQNKRYYGKKILENYQLVIFLATERVEVSGYFSLMIPCTHALMAEYLFEIYRGTKLSDVRDAVEMCYKKSISTFSNLPDLPIVEFLKINLDLVNFYETILEEMSPNSHLKKIYKYYDKMMEVLFRCKAAHVLLMNNDWKYEPPTSFTLLNSDSMTNILLKTLQAKLIQNFETRLQKRRIEKRKDIIKEKYTELLRLSRNKENISLIYNLNEVFRQAKSCFSSFRRKDFMLELI